MKPRKLSLVVPVPDLPKALPFWEALLCVPPGMVDGARWAQFEVAGGSLAVSSGEDLVSVPTAMVKVSDLKDERIRLLDSGFEVSDVEQGPHELRCLATSPGDWPVVLYEPG